MTITKKPGYWIERTRVAPVIQKWVENHRRFYDTDPTRPVGEARTGSGVGAGERIQSSGALETLSFMTGVGLRTLYRIMNTDQEYVSVDLVDRLLTGMDQVHLFHLPPEQDGFADVYEHPEIIGAAA